MCKSICINSSVDSDVDQLILVFNSLFLVSLNTVLVKGDGEPIYLPANENCSFHQIKFAHGFFSSALHEIAHWCIAGKQRRLLQDYGYWYVPDGRSKKQQSDFEGVEVKPQALEWMFSKICGRRFTVSVDNLSGEETNTDSFKQAVLSQVHTYCFADNLPKRAQLFVDKLKLFYGFNRELLVADFSVEEIN